MILAYTDGGCSGNPGPGGWAFVLSYDGALVEGSGGVGETTNNRMELTAVIQALEHVLSRGELRQNVIDLYTDSMYVKKGITEWIKNWLANGWKNKAKKPVKNKELWQQLLELTGQLKINWNWTPGHSGVELNERCDRLVRHEIDKIL
jgi:ribonuclease HI